MAISTSEAPQPKNQLAEFLAGHPKILAISWVLAVGFVFCAFPVGYLTWYVALVALWKWGQYAWWQTVLAVFGSAGLIIAPFIVVIMAVAFAGFLADISLAVNESVARKARDTLRDAEREALESLEKSDKPGLLPLLKYSRAQLEAYYAVGLVQARRSFMNSVLAMWLGFIVLLAGLTYQVVGPRLNLGNPSSDFRNLTLGSGAIIEFISAAFLWVYRSATVQLTNFYNRQMHTHASILSFRIAETMKNSSTRDDVKGAIVHSILIGATMVDPPTARRQRAGHATDGVASKRGKEADGSGRSQPEA